MTCEKIQQQQQQQQQTVLELQHYYGQNNTFQPT
jgi:hypothetical protein